MSFGPGDIAWLRSGGPAMTVKAFSSSGWVCVWFSTTNELKEGVFAEKILLDHPPFIEGL